MAGGAANNTDMMLDYVAAMYSDEVAANSDNMMHHHVLEVVLDETSLLAQGIYEVITEGVET
jgi:hypothetical protein